jgi:beta-1,4-N-acetylglucosaminyltransferase
VIFVGVGTHTQGFDRLLHVVDEWAAAHDEPVVAQIGNSTFTPSYCRWFRFASADEIDELISTSRVVVTHGGAGMLLQALKRGRPLLIMPRLARFNEAIDDHQIELADALQATGRARKFEDAVTFAGALASDVSPVTGVSTTKELIAAVAGAVGE